MLMAHPIRPHPERSRRTQDDCSEIASPLSDEAHFIELLRGRAIFVAQPIDQLADRRHVDDAAEPLPGAPDVLPRRRTIAAARGGVPPPPVAARAMVRVRRPA